MSRIFTLSANNLFFSRLLFSQETDTDEEMKEAFQVFDKDCNGFISPSEVAFILLIESLIY